MRLATATAWVVLPIVAGSGLYLLKMQVEAQEQRLVGLQKRIADDRESIHVLDAEWSYLNDPERLRTEADRLLGMEAIKPSQIVTFDQVPFPDPAPAADSPAVSSVPDRAPSAAARPRAVAKADPPSDPIAAAIAALTRPPRRKHP